jgi:hypothetical protein
MGVSAGGCSGPSISPREPEGAASRHSETVALLPHPGKDEDPSLLRGADGAFWLAWFSERSGNADIWMTRSPDGVHWQPPWQVTSHPDADFCPSLLQARDRRFHLAWFRQAARSGIRNIYYASGDAHGRNWSAPRAITREQSEDWVPSLMEDAKRVLWIAWASNRTGNKDIFLVRSGDRGKTWSQPRQITDHPEEDDFPCLAQLGSGAYCLVWTRHRQRRKGEWLPNDTSEVMCSRSRDGERWSQPRAITRDRFADAFPAIHRNVSASKYFVSWTTNRYGPQAGIAGVMLSESMQYPAAPFRITPLGAQGYYARLAPTDREGLYLLVWVSKTDRGDLDLFRQFVRH